MNRIRQNNGLLFSSDSSVFIRALLCSGSARLRSGTLNLSTINRGSRLRDGLKVQDFFIDFAEQKCVVCVEPFVRNAGLEDIALAQLCGVSNDKVGNPALRLDALVEVFVPR